MNRVFLALGTNLGERSKNLQAVMQALPPEVEVLAVSPIYETPPWGFTDQPAFLNQVVEGQTELSHQELLVYLKRLEAELGRTPTFRYGPRLIDLDILFFNDLVIESDGLVIPHPKIAERAFVLVPLADLIPDLVHPVLGSTIAQLRDATDTSEIRLYDR